MNRTLRLSLAAVLGIALLAGCKPSEPPAAAKDSKPAAAKPAVTPAPAAGAPAAAAPAEGGVVEISKLTSDLASYKGKTVTVDGFLVSTTAQGDALNVSVGTTPDVGAKEGVLCIAGAAEKDAFGKVAAKSAIKVTGKVAPEAFFGKPKLTDCVIAK